MALTARLCGKGFLALNSISGVRVLSTSTFLYKPVTIQPQPVPKLAWETHEEKNSRLKRPQSPHLTIYKFQLTSMLSITHRMTGLALTAYVAGLGVTSFVKPMPEVFAALHSHPILLLGVKLIVVYPFTYHFVNGIRHLVWDSGNALSIKGVYSTGYSMLAISAILTAILLAL